MGFILMIDFLNRNLNFVKNFGSQNLNRESIDAGVKTSVKRALFRFFLVQWSIVFTIQKDKNIMKNTKIANFYERFF